MYQLVDFGNGRKLEQFGSMRLDRPCPIATGAKSVREWTSADAVFRLGKGHKGIWHFKKPVPEDWKLKTVFGGMRLFPTDFGHVGVFAEQQDNWRWLSELPLSGLKILNLFAYTGGSSLAAAQAGSSVTHVDAAKNIVRRASDNAKISQLDSRPVRWIVEDARKFVAREIKRGNRYDGVILDPPSYGHGASPGTTWKIDEHIEDLLGDLATLIPECRLMLFTCHSPGFTTAKMMQLLHESRFAGEYQRGSMELRAKSGGSLAFGSFCRRFT